MRNWVGTLWYVLSQYSGNLMEILKNSKVVRRTGRSEEKRREVKWQSLQCILTLRVNVHIQCCGFSSVPLSALAKFGKIDFLISVCLSAWNMSAPTGRIFMKFDIWILFEHLWENQFHRNVTRYSTCRPVYINCSTSLNSKKCFRQML